MILHLEIHHVFEDLHAVSATIPSAKKKELSTHSSIKFIEEDPIVKVDSQTPNQGYRELICRSNKEYRFNR